MPTMAVPKLEAAWNSHSGKAVSEAFTPDGVRIEHAFPGARLEGRDAIAAQTQIYLDAVPDSHLEVRHISEVSDGEVTLEWTFRGTHTGELPGVPTRGEAVALDGVSVLLMDGDLIREERVYWDGATLLAGAGAIG
jgi:steroid delta-isomerase-like uncharacterized protein